MSTEFSSLGPGFGFLPFGLQPSSPGLHNPLSPSSAATRESAFVHAIASAGVAFAVTRSCAEGSAAICGCSSRLQGSPGEGWKWGGCSEDIEFGGMVSREFADARENRPDARSAMNRHNNEAGRQVCAQKPRAVEQGLLFHRDVQWGRTRGRGEVLLVTRLLCLPSIKGHCAQLYLKCPVCSQRMPDSPVDIGFLEVDRWQK